MVGPNEIETYPGAVGVRFRVLELQRRLHNLGRRESELYRRLARTIEEREALRRAFQRALMS